MDFIVHCKTHCGNLGHSSLTVMSTRSCGVGVGCRSALALPGLSAAAAGGLQYFPSASCASGFILRLLSVSTNFSHEALRSLFSQMFMASSFLSLALGICISISSSLEPDTLSRKRQSLGVAPQNTIDHQVQVSQLWWLTGWISFQP